MSFSNAVSAFKEAIEGVAEKRGDYLVELDFAANDVDEYLIFRGGNEELSAELTAAVEAVENRQGDWLYMLESVAEKVELLVS